MTKDLGRFNRRELIGGYLWWGMFLIGTELVVSLAAVLMGVRYEDLIYDYYPTTRRIMEYIGKTDRPEDEFKFFHPDLSVKYTRADLTYPGHEGEIKYIKEQLPEYLYQFPMKYTPVAEQAGQSAKG